MSEEKKKIMVKNTEAGVRIEIMATEEMKKRWKEFCKRLGFAFTKREAVPEGLFETEGFNPFRDIYYFNNMRETADLIEALILAGNNKLKEENSELWALLLDLSSKHKVYAEAVLSKDEEGEETLEKIFLAGKKPVVMD